MKKAILMLLGCVLVVAVKAQIPQPDPDTTAKHFLQVASIGNLQEVSAGQLAIQQSKRDDVRSFGRMMVKEHGEAEEKLKQLARTKHINLTPAASGDIKPDLKLKNAGANFDKFYVHAMLAGHHGTVQMFENYATTGKDPDVRAFAKQMLPTLKHHLQVITAIDNEMKKAAAK
ncbi:MAG: DUF4142 domain-containing protein [Bacteroidetes bacterium]|nr:DUF4142 domain-containing protein [Bacteroidota bacterium]